MVAPLVSEQRAHRSSFDVVSAVGASLTRITERWIPDSWVICVFLTAVVMVLAVVRGGATAHEATQSWATGLWSLLEITMQFSIAAIMAYACVASKPLSRIFRRLASLPNPDRPRQAVCVLAVFSLVGGYLNWTLSMIGSALFLPYICQQNPKADVRILAAAAYLGMGTTWHGGLSGSAPLILATPGNPFVRPAAGPPILDRLVPVTETIFVPFNLIYLVVISIVALCTIIALHPSRGTASPTAAPQIDRDNREAFSAPHGPITPAARIDRMALWPFFIAILLVYSLAYSFWARGFGATWTINAYNMILLAAALLLHGSATSFLQACRAGLGPAGGLIIQFPFYGAIFSVISNTGLRQWLSDLFVQIASRETFPMVVYVYSAMMNIFVPVGSAKWLLEGPYVLVAAQELGVSITTTVLSYAYGDATTHLIQPFLALPILAVANLRFGDIAGYTSVVCIACFLTTMGAMVLVPATL